MTRTGVSVLAAVGLFSAINAGAAAGGVRLERPERRPYIVEVGQPYPISLNRLEYEVSHISELGSYVRDYGYPDYAELQEIVPEWPWKPYEVRLYYLQRNLEVDFGPVPISEALRDLGVLKFRGDITPEKRHEIEVVLQAREAPAPAPVVLPPPPAPEPAAEPAAPRQQSSGGLTEALVARIEAAAERAAQAADRAAEDSAAAARAAERTVQMVQKMEQQGIGAR